MGLCNFFGKGSYLVHTLVHISVPYAVYLMRTMFQHGILSVLLIWNSRYNAMLEYSAA